MKDMGYVQFVFRTCPKEKIGVAALKTVSQFGVTLKLCFCSAVSRPSVKIKFQKRNSLSHK